MSNNNQPLPVVERIRGLTCCCCGARTRGRQWHNRDTGFGLCSSCVIFIKGRGMPAEEMRGNYGVEGEHYNVSEGTVAKRYQELTKIEKDYKELVTAAYEVIDKWSEGNLADAVNNLEGYLPPRS